MAGNFLEEFVQNTQAEVTQALEDLVAKEGIKEKVLRKAEGYARTAAAYILNESNNEPLKKFKGVEFVGDEEVKYLLVLEFLQSAGFKFAPSVLKFESQHPELQLDRRELGKRLRLRTYDRTPYLVQLIEAAEENPVSSA
jgi:hypothetical protein